MPRNSSLAPRVVCVCLLLLAPAAVVFEAQAQTATNVQRLLEIAQESQARINAGRNQLYDALLNSQDPDQQALNSDPSVWLVYIDPNGVPRYEGGDSRDAGIFVRTNEVHPGGAGGYNLNGMTTTGQEMGIWDGGVPRTTHIEYAGRITIKDGGAIDYHATIAAGPLIAGGNNPGLGVNQTLPQGMSYAAELAAWDFNDDTSEMATAASEGTVISNHSYGERSGWKLVGTQMYWYGNLMIDATRDFKFGHYGPKASEWDDVAYNAPYYLIVKSSGNDANEGTLLINPGDEHKHWEGGSFITATDIHEYDGQSKNGYDTIASYGVAKNILTVGACSDFAGSYTQPSDAPIGDSSSRGPTDDGRIKPDIVAPGLLLYTPVIDTDTSYANQSGTSVAAPIVTGSANLMREHYEVKYGKAPRSATLKALIINTAEECGPADGPDYTSGWGLLNTRRAIDVIDAVDPSTGVGIGETILHNGDTHYFYFRSELITDFKVTIAWTDPAHAAISDALDDPTKVLVNDLDLRIDYLSGTPVTHEPWVLDPMNYEDAATTGDNDTDNVEQVLIADAAPGLYRVSVSHKGVLTDAPQAYSLVWSGMAPTQEAVDVVGSRFELFPGLLPDPSPPFNVAETSGEERGIFVTIFEDILVREIGLRAWVPCPATFFVSVYEAGGIVLDPTSGGLERSSLGQPIAEGSIESYHPGWSYHYVPVNVELLACQDYYISFQQPQNMLSWPWYNEGLLGEPIDVGGAVRIRDGALAQNPANGAMPLISIIGDIGADPDDVQSNLEPPNIQWGTCADNSTERGLYIQPERTIRVQALSLEAAVAEGARFTAKIYEAVDTARGKLIAEGGRTIDQSSLQMHEVPVGATLYEGKQYNVVMEFAPTTWSCYSDQDAPFTVDNTITVLDGESAGDANVAVMPHMELRWREGAGGVPFDLSKQGDVVPPPFSSSSDVNNYGIYVKSSIDQGLYSIGWHADVPAGKNVIINLYEANGTTRGTLLSSGSVASTASGMRWHDAPVSASLAADGEYDFEVVMDGVNEFRYWDDSSGLPFEAYGAVTVVDGESWGNPADNTMIYMRMNACGEATTGVGPNESPAAPPAFALQAPFPNPASGIARIRYSLDAAGPVTIRVYDVLGRRAATLLSGEPRPPGPGTVVFDTRDVPQGTYFVRLVSPTKSVTRKISVVR